MENDKYSLKERLIAIVIVIAVFLGFALWFYIECGKPNLPNGDKIVCITRTGSKYHYASCSYLHSSSIKIYLEEADAKGYGSCSRCDPPEYISEAEYNERRANRSPVLLIMLSLGITGFLWGIIYSFIKELCGKRFMYILFAIAYCIVLSTMFLCF